MVKIDHQMSNSLKKAYKDIFSEVTEVPDVLKQSHFPSLDGFRGISIILVIVYHLNNSVPYFIFNGGLGVAIFFVISGFLITTLLFKEKVKTGNISLKRFYIRRALRIFPVCYLYIIVIFILNFILHLHLSFITFLVAGLYLMNFSYFLTHFGSGLFGHFWSLSVEEQFYLFFPYLLKKHFKLYLSIIIAIIFILPFVLLITETFHALSNSIIYAASHYLIKFQSIAVGCLCAVLLFKNYINLDLITKYKLHFNILVIVSFFFIQYDENFSIKIVFINLLISVLAGYLIISNLYYNNDFIFKFLNSKVMGFLGVLSYSLYIWQQLFTKYNTRFPAFMSKLPFNLVLLIIVACVSYFIYERRFLKLKDKFEPKLNTQPSVSRL